jgi:oxygen-independent coproporphyrinogen-3 oxidase
MNLKIRLLRLFILVVAHQVYWATEDIEGLINLIRTNYKVSDHPEITLEANPDDLNSEKIVALSKSSVNRLSIGVQSFFDDDLKSMNRTHSAQEAKKCLIEAQQYFDNITIDLIYGIPTMSLEKWHDNLHTAFNFGVRHLSTYALTVEPKTALHSFIKKGSYPPVDEGLALQHFNHLIAETKQQGFIHYEISNFAKPNYFSQHNTSYWSGKHYIGIGPSAHSYDGKCRSWNISNNSKYIKSLGQNELPQERETLTETDRYNEYIMTGLRTIHGVSLEVIRTEFGAPYVAHFTQSSQHFIENDLLLREGMVIKTSDKGKFLCDGIASDLFVLAKGELSN